MPRAILYSGCLGREGQSESHMERVPEREREVPSLPDLGIESQYACVLCDMCCWRTLWEVGLETVIIWRPWV